MGEVNLHLGCGPVYLEGWINIDVYQKGYTHLASIQPSSAFLDYNRTTLDRYYKYKWGERKGDFVVVDQYMDLSKTPYPFEEDSVDKILVVNTFEHFSIHEGKELLKEWYRILRRGGILLTDVPDLIGTFKLLEKAKSLDEMNWAIRLIYGSQKNPYSFHKWGYTFATLFKLLSDIGFKNIERTDLIKHDYPVLMVKGVK